MLPVLNKHGVGMPIDFEKPFLLVLFHPVTTEYASQAEQIEALLEAVRQQNMQTVLLWPNIDAGSDRVTKAIRRFREIHRDFPLHAYKNLEPPVYLPLLKRAACCVGNSSSFVRETSFLGTPVVLVGDRQDGREWSHSVKRVTPDLDSIRKAIEDQLAHGHYEPQELYGKAGASREIAESIAKLEPYVQKRLHYPEKDGGNP